MAPNTGKKKNESDWVSSNAARKAWVTKRYLYHYGNLKPQGYGPAVQPLHHAAMKEALDRAKKERFVLESRYKAEIAKRQQERNVAQAKTDAYLSKVETYEAIPRTKVQGPSVGPNYLGKHIKNMSVFQNQSPRLRALSETEQENKDKHPSWTRGSSFTGSPFDDDRDLNPNQLQMEGIEFLPKRVQDYIKNQGPSLSEEEVNAELQKQAVRAQHDHENLGDILPETGQKVKSKVGASGNRLNLQGAKSDAKEFVDTKSIKPDTSPKTTAKRDLLASQGWGQVPAEHIDFFNGVNTIPGNAPHDLPQGITPHAPTEGVHVWLHPDKPGEAILDASDHYNTHGTTGPNFTHKTYKDKEAGIERTQEAFGTAPEFTPDTSRKTTKQRDKLKNDGWVRVPSEGIDAEIGVKPRKGVHVWLHPDKPDKAIPDFEDYYKTSGVKGPASFEETTYKQKFTARPGPGGVPISSPRTDETKRRIKQEQDRIKRTASPWAKLGGEPAIFHRGSREAIYREWNPEGPSGGGGDGKPPGGWKRTVEFENEQRKRKWDSMRGGNYYRGYKVFHEKSNKLQMAPQEKSDIGIGANKEYVMPTSDYDLLNIKDKTKNSTLRLTLNKDLKFDTESPPAAELVDDDTGGVIYSDTDVEGESSPTLNKIFSDAGVTLPGPVRILTDKDANQVISVTTKAGYRDHEGKMHTTKQITPQKQREIENVIKAYAVENNIGGSIVDSHLRASPMKQRIDVVPHHASKVAGLNIDSVIKGDAYDRGIVSNSRRVKTKIGLRDEKGNLRTGESDSVHVRLPNNHQTYITLKDRTDATGYGTTWRPGEHELGNLLTLHARRGEELNLLQATETHNGGDSSKLDQYIRRREPGLNEQGMEQKKKEYLHMGEALGASAYWTARHKSVQSAARRGTNVTYNKVVDSSEKLTAWDEKHQMRLDPETGKSTNKVWNSRVDAYKTGGSVWLADMKWKVAHPLSDPSNPASGGLSRSTTELFTPHKFYYRKTKISPARRDARALVRDRKYLMKLAVSKEQLGKQIEQKKAGRLSRMSARNFQHDPNILAFDAKVEDLRSRAEHSFSTANAGSDERKVAQETLAFLDPDNAKGIVGRFHAEGLTEKIFNLAEHNTRHIEDGKAAPHKIHIPLGKAGLYGAGAAAVVGGGIYLNDNLRKDPSGHHPLYKLLPAKIKTPSIGVTRTHDYNIPVNFVTDALDMGGSKVPVQWKIDAGWKEHVIKKGIYKPAPLFGKLKVRAETPTPKFKLKTFTQLRPDGTGQVHKDPTIAIGKFDTGVVLNVGNKQRWKDVPRSQRLNTVNTSKLTTNERMQIASYLDQDPDLTDPFTRSLHERYSSDASIREILDDPEQMYNLRQRSGDFQKSRGKERRDAKHKKQLEQQIMESNARLGETVDEERDRKEGRRRDARDYAHSSDTTESHEYHDAFGSGAGFDAPDPSNANA